MNLLWLDLETTGTDEHNDAILEVVALTPESIHDLRHTNLVSET